MLDRRNFMGAATLALLAGLVGCSDGDKLSNLRGMDLTDSALGRDFSLKGTDGKAHTLADFKGQVVMVFFGFTQCPDVCPTALVRAVEIKQKLGDRGKDLQVLFVTVDPERDTPEVLSAYVTAFDPSFIGLYGSPDQIKTTAKEYKVYYSKIQTGSSYTMDHTALSYVYDTQGKLRVALRHNQPIDDFINDIKEIMKLHG